MRISTVYARLIAAWLIPFLYVACGGRALSNNAAKELLANSYPGLFDKEILYIESVSQTGQRNAVVEATLRVAFRFEKIEGQWQIREVRFGNNQWEKIDIILRALGKVKVDETHQQLEQVGIALQKYWEKVGRLPDFRDYVTLSDALYPSYLNPLIRFDAWQHPLFAYKISANAIRLVSSGPDGKPGTSDDLDLTKTFAP